MTEDPARWGQPFAALLGAYAAQMGLGLPSIGGKDSMSGTFDDEHGEINVPPTLVSFAVDVDSSSHMITPEFKRAGSKIVVYEAPRNRWDLPEYGKILEDYGKLRQDILDGKIISAYAVERFGWAEAVSKMAFGNKMGFLCPRLGRLGVRGSRRQGGKLVHLLPGDRRSDGGRRILLWKCADSGGRGSGALGQDSGRGISHLHGT